VIKLFKELAIIFFSLCLTVVIFSLFFSIFTLPVKKEDIKPVPTSITKKIDKKELNEVIYDDDFIYAKLDNQAFCIKNPYLLALGRPPFESEKSILSASNENLINKAQCQCLLKISKQFINTERPYTPKIIFKGKTYQSITWFYPKLGHSCWL